VLIIGRAHGNEVEPRQLIDALEHKFCPEKKKLRAV
jgi:hypothetical protein